MAETPWYRNRDVQEAIRNLIIAILLVVLALLGYDVGVAQPRLEQALAGQRAESVGSAAMMLYPSPEDGETPTGDTLPSNTLTYCVEGGPCVEVRVRH